MDTFVLSALGPVHWLLLIGLAVVLFVVIRKLRGGAEKDSSPAPVVDLTELTVADARRGDMVTVRHAAPDYEDLEFKVQHIHRYESGGSKWHELAGKSPHGEVALEWEHDDGLQVGLSFAKTHRIEELTSNGTPLTEDHLVRFDEEQSSANTVEFEGDPYHFASSGEIGFFEDGQGDGEGFYSWEFEADDGKSSLSIEKWEGEAFAAQRSATIDPDDVQIYRA
ncbi:MAG: DUF4178 domain-containing protein [Planctomycetota bacterium]